MPLPDFLTGTFREKNRISLKWVQKDSDLIQIIIKMEEIDSVPTSQEVNQPELLDNSRRAKTLIILFSIFLAFLGLAIYSDYLQLQLLYNASASFVIDESVAVANDLRQSVLGLIQIGLYIVTVVVFLNWFRRAYGNLHRLGITNLKHNETMAVWCWIIPIIWFFRPVQIMNEIWRETQLAIKKFDNSYLSRSGAILIGFWWAIFILSNFIGRYILKTAFKEDTIEQLIESSQAMIFSDVLQIPETLLVILIVRQLSVFESKLAGEVIKSGGKIMAKH